jgi:hypothetical protein
MVADLEQAEQKSTAQLPPLNRGRARIENQRSKILRSRPAFPVTSGSPLIKFVDIKRSAEKSNVEWFLNAIAIQGDRAQGTN